MYNKAKDTSYACKDCDNTNSMCYGGSIVAPLSGYWRGQDTLPMTACPRPESCL